MAKGAGESAEKVIKDIRRKTRRRFSAEEKIRIVLEGLRGEESIATLCRREGIVMNLYYRWSHEKIVRSTHGVNCTGSCSWDVFVKNGIVIWEMQATDYPRTRPDLPNHGETIAPNGGDCKAVLASFAEAGVDTGALAARLQDEGAASFVKSWNELMACVDSKHAAFHGAS